MSGVVADAFFLALCRFSKVSRTDRDGKSYRLIADAEQVNDLFATTTDPGAWEFRHPLFRRGEPQLLASIKRKTTRPSNADGGALASPTEEYDQNRAMAGWMRESGGPNMGGGGYRNSPPRDKPMGGPPPQGRPKVYGYNAQTGETITPRHPGEGPRPTSRGHQWDGPPGHSSRMTMPPPPPGIEHGAQQRYHPEASRPSLSSRFAPLGYPDSPYHPQPHHSPTEALSTQVATLEDRVQRLAEVLNGERLDNIRSNLDFTSYLLQLIGWLDDKQCKYTVDLSNFGGADPSFCATRPARPARHAQPSEFRPSTAV